MRGAGVGEKMSRELWQSLAREAARDPSRAPRIAGYLTDLLRAARSTGGRLPDGYVYAGAYQFVIQAENLAVEPLPTDADPNRAPITSTSNNFIPLRVPFDMLIMGIGGWAQPQGIPQDQSTLVFDELDAVNNISCSPSSRDLFSVEIGLDGQVNFGTDGRNRFMFPASVVVGARNRPRAAAWTVRRNQIIQTRFRNITNVFLDGVDPSILIAPNLVTAAVAYYALNLEAP